MRQVGRYLVYLMAVQVSTRLDRRLTCNSDIFYQTTQVRPNSAGVLLYIFDLANCTLLEALRLCQSSPILSVTHALLDAALSQAGIPSVKNSN